MAQRATFESIEGLYEIFEGYGLSGSIESRDNEDVFAINGPYPLHDVSEREVLDGITNISRDYIQEKHLNSGTLVWIFKICINDEHFFYESRYDIEKAQLQTVRHPLQEVIDWIVPPGFKDAFRVQNFFVIKDDEHTLTIFEAAEFQAMKVVINPNGLGIEVKSLNVRLPGTHLDDSARERVISSLESVMETILDHFGLHTTNAADPQALKDALYEVIESKGSDRGLAPTTFELTEQEPATLEVAKLFTTRIMFDDGRADLINLYGNGKDLWLYNTSFKDNEPIMRTLEKITVERALAVADQALSTMSEDAPKRINSETIN